MNCYPQNIEQKLGFNKIRQYIKEACLSNLGEELCEKIKFSNNYKKISNQLGFVDEFLQILINSEDFPTNYYYDLRPALSKISTPGTYLTEEELNFLRLSLINIVSIRDFFLNKDEDVYPLNRTQAARLRIDRSIVISIDKIIDEKGIIKDKASPELYEIRQDLERQKRQVSKKIHEVLKVAKKESWASPDANVSIRDGKVVIPVSSFSKRQLGGIVVDESASGQTSYVEPREVVELNNKIRELFSKERKEIVKILIKISDYLRDYIYDLSKAYDFLGYVDFNRAKAVFAKRINAYKPKIENKRTINWRQASHPLLFLKLQAQKKQVVPLDIELSDKRNRILLISGPNAGGKSISLQTVALLQYMMQSGLLVPSSPDSTFGIFSNLLIDIGDEQSIDNDLSTYSSHLLNMKNFLKLGNSKSLIFIDEFGTGTEPILGGAIAEAVLQKFVDKSYMGVITTHYGNLKQFATNIKGIVNGAMLYDTHLLEPTFKLNIGKAGSSFAFEAARKIGLDENILKLAEKKIGKEQIDYDKNLRAIARDKLYVEKKREEIRIAERKHKKLVESYEEKLQNIRKEQREILTKAKNEADVILSGANKLIENTVSSIKKSQADKAKTKAARAHFEEKKEIIINKVEHKEKTISKKIKKQESNIHKKTYEVGDKVRLKGQQAIGEIIQMQNKTAHVAYGNITTKINTSKLEHITENEYKNRISKSIRNNNSAMSDQMIGIKQGFSNQLDVRGKRAEEAIEMVKEYIDNAIVCDAHEVKILHGTGTGALRFGIREYLAGLPHVSSFKDENVKLGGAGITVVKF
jgi:DNA mismatch repair protein MutS2